MSVSRDHRHGCRALDIVIQTQNKLNSGQPETTGELLAASSSVNGTLKSSVEAPQWSG